MTQPQPIPKLDLAPKLNRPLSLWNPLDYLRLLYWCFYFPQALHDYQEKYKNKNNFFQLKFRFQQLLLTIVVPFLFCELLQQIGFLINWYGVVLGIVLSMVLSIELDTILGLMLSLVLSVVFGVADDVIFGVADSIVLGLIFSMLGSVEGGLEFGLVVSIMECMTFGIVPGIVFCAAFSITILRLENWLIYSFLNLQSLQNSTLRFPHVTPIPLPSLESHLRKWLRQDWLQGLQNANELLRYSVQFIPIIKAVNQVLAEVPSKYLIFRVSQLAADPYNLKRYDILPEIDEELHLVTDWKLYKIELRVKKAHQVAALGFWHLYERQPKPAKTAFSIIQNFLYGREMLILAYTLAKFQAAQKPNSIAAIKLPPFPSKNLLRPITWNALNGLRRVIEDVQLILDGTSKSARSFALNRAIGELKTIRDNGDSLPKAEQGLILDIAETWTTALESIAQEIGNISITQPIQNPYVIGDPVEGSLFVGREDIMRDLEQLWITSQHLQSVVLYGHRRMGKTSILRNIANRSGAEIKVIYINLQGLGSISEGMGEVLMAISDGISDALGVPPPEDEALLRLPQRTFERYLTKVVHEMNYKGLIIALDEFEMIEEFIEAGQIPPNFMGVLRGLLQMSSKVAFVFAGLHTLEEMTEDYFQPFFASVIPIRVGFLKPASTRQILANPNNDFLLNYTGEALDLIHNLTAGQPYLVQLVGFLLVRRYNEQVFELERSRDSTFTIEDVEVIINDPEFFSRGRYYFTGVWNQAKEPPGQHKILEVLAVEPEGLTLNDLRKKADLELTRFNEALETLKRHDVVRETENRCKIIVELFRRWVVENHQSS